MGVNKVILVGNVGNDPEIKALPSGSHLTKFRFATTDNRSKDEQGNPRTEWHNIVTWGKLAEFCSQYVNKGRQLYIEGQIRTRTWEAEGRRNYMTEIHANTIELLGGPRDSGGNGSRRDNLAGDPGGPGSGFPDDDDVPF